MKKYLTGKQLKQTRSKLQISQEKLANKTNISRYHLHRHENELYQLSDRDMEKIIKFLDKAQNEYFKGGIGY